MSSDRLSGGSDETVKITNKKYLCRVISYEKLTSYLTEDFSWDMNFVFAINLESILSPYAIYLDKSAIYIMYERHLSL